MTTNCYRCCKILLEAALFMFMLLLLLNNSKKVNMIMDINQSSSTNSMSTKNESDRNATTMNDKNMKMMNNGNENYIYDGRLCLHLTESPFHSPSVYVHKRGVRMHLCFICSQLHSSRVQWQGPETC